MYCGCLFAIGGSSTTTRRLTSSICFPFAHRLPHPLLLTSLARNRDAVIEEGRELNVVYCDLHNKIRISQWTLPVS